MELLDGLVTRYIHLRVRLVATYLPIDFVPDNVDQKPRNRSCGSSVLVLAQVTGLISLCFLLAY